MSSWQLLKRSLWFYRRTNLGILLGTAIASAILVGAFLVGDSVSYSLRRIGQLRLGKVELVLVGRDRFFRSELAHDLARRGSVSSAAVLQLNGLATNDEGSIRINQVQVYGVDGNFWKLAPGLVNLTLSPTDICLNKSLARALKVNPGDEVLIRVNKPSLLPREAPLAKITDLSVALRLTVKVIAAPEQFGDFSLRANQIAPFNAFVNRELLQKKIALPARANMLLLAPAPGRHITVRDARSLLKRNWQLADAMLRLRDIPRQGQFEITSGRIFIAPTLVEVMDKFPVKAQKILTYFVNGIRLGQRTTPYSMVTALQKGVRPDSPVPADMHDDEIVINQWLADDLQAKIGEIIELRYFVSSPGRRLQERTSTFRLRQIVPLTGAAADDTLMPDYPGLHDVKNCRDWKPGIPIDLGLIRDKDEQYWQRYRGTPKAFITLAAGQRIWKNSFGSVTSLRFPLQAGLQDKLRGFILQQVAPAQLGLLFQPVAQQARSASGQALDLGQYFLGLSFFIIVSAVLLTCLLFTFGVEQRSEELGILTALGFTSAQIRHLWLWEGAILAFLGAVVGILGGVVYTMSVLHGLSTSWQAAVGSTTIQFHAKISSLVAGAAIGLFLPLLVMWLMLRGKLQQRPYDLLRNNPDINLFSHDLSAEVRPVSWPLWLALTSLLGALAIIFFGWQREKSSVEAFFGAGSLLLIAVMCFAWRLFKRPASAADTVLSLNSLAWRNSTRRPGRTMAVIALLACGIFIVVAVGAFRSDPMADSRKASGGTGGFTLIGKAAIPLFRNLNQPEVQKEYGLEPDMFSSVRVTSLRVRPGDDASCLNLNRAQVPRLLGVDPADFQAHHSFSFVSGAVGKYKANPWSLLEKNLGPDVIPAVADQATIKWALGKALGDKLTYIDDYGKTVKLQLVGGLQNSILQGSLIISQEQFIRHFPSRQGYQLLLIDCPPDKASRLADLLERRLRDNALTVIPAVKQLMSFYAMENTYLSMFQLLGGLGLLLGSFGLGLVLLRNVLERRNEFAMLRAVGYTLAAIRQLVLREHVASLVLGMVCGIIPGIIAVLPALRWGGQHQQWGPLLLTLILLLLNGFVWIWLAASLSLRGNLLSALRNE